MPWKKEFETIDPETGELTAAKVKVDENGVVTDFATGYEYDREGGKHGHTWNLHKEPEEIGGRDPVDSSGKSIYDDQDDKTAEEQEIISNEEEDYSEDVEAAIVQESGEQSENLDLGETGDYSEDVETSIASQESEGQAESLDEAIEGQDGDGDSQCDSDLA